MPTYKCKRCSEPVVKNGYCAVHSQTKEYVDKAKLATYQKNRKPRKVKRKQYDLNNDTKWNKLALIYLSQNPLCVRCASSTKPLRYQKKAMAVHVDHIKPVSKFPDLKYDEANLQSLCISCHSKKSAFEQKGLFYDYKNNQCFVMSKQNEVL